MKNKKWILPVCIVAAAAVLCIGAVLIFDAVLNAQGYSISVGRLYFSDDGTYLIDSDDKATLVLDCTDNAELFKGYESGDKIILFHDGVDESFPARIGGYRIFRLSKSDRDYTPPGKALGAESQDIYYVGATRNIDFGAQYIRTNTPSFEADFPIVTAIRSKDELTAYYDTNKDKLGLGKQGGAFDAACKKYDDKFFEDNALIFVVLEEGSGSISHNVESVKIDDSGELHINILSISPESGTCDMAYWHIMVAVPKQDTPDSSEDILVYYNDKVMTNEHSHGPAAEEQTAQNGPDGYCGNTQTTIYFEDIKSGATTSYNFMGSESVAVTDILVNLEYDKKKMCRCMPEYKVQTEFGSYGIHITESYARCSDGQAELTTAQSQTLYKIIEWARNKAQ